MSFSTLPGDGIYLDHNATTPLAMGLAAEIPSMLRAWGNPSSIHWAGRSPKLALRQARERLAKLLQVHPLELVFTSGGTEGNNLALRGVYQQMQRTSPERTRVIVSAVEHPSVLKTAEQLIEQGAEVCRVPVSRAGEVDLAAYESYLSERTAVVSMMYANNETGHIFPIKKMAQMAHKVGAVFHSDCVQTLGKVSIHLPDLEVDLATFSAHKFYALKGAGVLFTRRGVKWIPQQAGGGQERGRRGGTENVLAIAAMGWMAEPLTQMTAEKNQEMARLRDQFEARLVAEIPDVQITGCHGKRLANTSHCLIPGVDGEVLLMNLDILGFAVSTGAACSSGSPEPSPVLLAMGMSRQEAQCSLRVSLGWTTTDEELERFCVALAQVVRRIRSLEK